MVFFSIVIDLSTIKITQIHLTNVNIWNSDAQKIIWFISNLLSKMRYCGWEQQEYYSQQEFQNKIENKFTKETVIRYSNDCVFLGYQIIKEKRYLSFSTYSDRIADEIKMVLRN